MKMVIESNEKKVIALDNEIANMNDYELLDLIDEAMMRYFDMFRGFAFLVPRRGKDVLGDEEFLTWLSGGEECIATFEDVEYGDALLYSVGLVMLTNYNGSNTAYFYVDEIGNAEAKMTVFDSYGNSSEAYLLLSDARNECEAHFIVHKAIQTLLVDLVSETARFRMRDDICIED